MSYLSTTDFADDPAFVDRFQRDMKGDLDLSWMKVDARAAVAAGR